MDFKISSAKWRPYHLGFNANDSHQLGLREKWVNTLRPRRSRRHFADDIFKCILLNENVSISIKISLKCIPKGPINNIPAMLQIMTWRKPLSETMMIISLTHICVTRHQWVNTLRPGQNGHPFAECILTFIFVKENWCIFIQVSLISFAWVLLTPFQH